VTVAVEGYDLRWAARGAELATRLRAALGPLAVRVELVGAAPGPVTAAYDLQASVRNLAEAAEAFDAPLAALGLVREPLQADDMPAGRLDPPARWAKRLWSRRTGAERIDLHVRVAGAPNERHALLLRDWFRAHPAVVPIRPDVRDPLVDLLVVTAEAWADRTGWRP
jgi:GrpB-like predicted nucleotidyltransferase (UPF0157 family)